MDTSGFGSTVGKKFNADGSVRRFRGNTIISKIASDMPVFEHVKRLQDMLRVSAGDCVTLLPEESYHMTVIEGLCEQVRIPQKWTSLLPLNAELAETDRVLSQAYGTVPPLGRTVMAMDSVRISGGVVYIVLKPNTQGDAANLRDFRDAVSEATGIRFPNHDGYGFHITLAYGIKRPDSGQEAALTAFVEQAGQYIREKQPAFILAKSVFTYFDNMFCFSETPLER